MTQIFSLFTISLSYYVFCYWVRGPCSKVRTTWLHGVLACVYTPLSEPINGCLNNHCTRKLRMKFKKFEWQFVSHQPNHKQRSCVSSRDNIFRLITGRHKTFARARRFLILHPKKVVTLCSESKGKIITPVNMCDKWSHWCSEKDRIHPCGLGVAETFSLSD